MESIIIGIAGGTGSGKTTLTRHLIKTFGESVSVVYHDNYYRANPDMPYEERCQLNYDHPNSFETDLMVAHLEALRQGQTVQCPTYDYTMHNRAEETVEVKPAPVILVEGILIFESLPLRSMMDIKIFVDTDADVRILRRIRRDVRDRGRTLESVIAQYLTTVKPMHEQFVQPSRQYADLVMLEGGKNQVAVDMITRKIDHYLKGEG